MEDPQFFIGQEKKKRIWKSETYRKHWAQQAGVSIAAGFSWSQVMTRRAFKHSVIMPQFRSNSIAVVLLFYFGLLTVRADLKGQPDLKRTQVTIDSINEPEAQHPILCECEFFVQSWKTSHMIRLPMGTYNLSLFLSIRLRYFHVSTKITTISTCCVSHSR